MSKTVNVTTEIVRPDGRTRYEWKNFKHLPEMQRGMSALLLDLSNTGGQMAAGFIPHGAGPNDKTMTVSMTVTHGDGSGHHAVDLRYDNFSDEGIAEVMRKVEHHLGVFKPTATVTKSRR
jgi:hypothetical protein